MTKGKSTARLGWMRLRTLGRYMRPWRQNKCALCDNLVDRKSLLCPACKADLQGAEGVNLRV